MIHFFAAANARNHPIYSIYPTIQNVAINRHFLHQEIKPFLDEMVIKVSPSTSHGHTLKIATQTFGHQIILWFCFPLTHSLPGLPTESNEMKEPAHKKSKLCIDSDPRKSPWTHKMKRLILNLMTMNLLRQQNMKKRNIFQRFGFF